MCGCAAYLDPKAFLPIVEGICLVQTVGGLIFLVFVHVRTVSLTYSCWIMIEACTSRPGIYTEAARRARRLVFVDDHF